MTTESNDPSQLPQRWLWTTLGEIGIVKAGGTPSTSISENFDGDIPWITPADLTGYRGNFIRKGRKNLSEKGLNSSSAVLLPKGTVLFSSRAPIGHVVIAENPVATNQGFKNLICHEGIFNEYVFYYLKGSKKLAESYGSGTTFKEISAARFAIIPIPLAPTPEQHRIVGKVEQLFPFLDAGVTSLRKVQAQLKRYDQAVLKYAFEGKLTEEWRERHKEQIEPAQKAIEQLRQERNGNVKRKGKESESTNPTNLPKLPESWAWIKLDQISVKITDGTHFTPTYVDSGVPFISVKDIFNRKISFKDCRHISQEAHAELIKRCHPEQSDVLITKSGTIGRVSVVRTTASFSLFVSVALIKLWKKQVNPEFVAFSLENYINSIDIKQSIKGGVIKNLHIEDLRKILLPFASLVEQNQIVEEINSRLSIAEELQKTVDSSIKQASLLRQSILKHAFAGKLVPQDTLDEPAEELLKRIRAEHTNQKVEVTEDSNKMKPRIEQVRLSRYVK